MKHVNEKSRYQKVSISVPTNNISAILFSIPFVLLGLQNFENY